MAGIETMIIETKALTKRFGDFTSYARNWVMTA
jgi:hypothetical protein